jgi:hypothetical protein
MLKSNMLMLSILAELVAMSASKRNMSAALVLSIEAGEVQTACATGIRSCRQSYLMQGGKSHKCKIEYNQMS